MTNPSLISRDYHDFDKCVLSAPLRLRPHGTNIPDGPFDVNERRRLIKRTTSGNRVLMIGRIRELALYRAVVLRDRGFDVSTPETHEDAVAAIRKGGFDIAVLSYTLPNDEVQELAELIHEYCQDCPLIAISSNQRIDRTIRPDEMVNADEGPAALIAALNKVRRAT
jgi:DNA-binding NtrC family response regulator